MNNQEDIVDNICTAFGENVFPGEHYLQGSFEGDETYEVIAPFKEYRAWETVDAEMLDRHYAALSFFSEAGLRFFLPAYIVADLRGELTTADPLFVLVNGFSDLAVRHQVGERFFVRKTGKTTFINPRRYGAITFYDSARRRLSVFSREEAQAIVVYLHFKRETDEFERERIDAALELYWEERAAVAPTREDIEQHLKDEQEYLNAIMADSDFLT